MQLWNATASCQVFATDKKIPAENEFSAGIKIQLFLAGKATL
jgi:hypothetical protein